MNALLNFLPNENRTEVQKMLIGVVVSKSFTFFAVLLAIISVSLYGIQFLFNQEIDRITTEQNTVQAQFEGSKQIDVESAIKSLNEQTKRLTVIQNSYVYWSVSLERLETVIPEGILISGFSIDSETRLVTLTGEAQTRESYYEFEKALQASPFIEMAGLPISLLKSDIKFSISITLTPEFFSYET